MNKMVNIEILKTDKYGRYLAEVSYKKQNISDWLLTNNYAVIYNGGKKEEFTFGKYNHLLHEDTVVNASIINPSMVNPSFVNVPLTNDGEDDGVFNF